MNAEPRRPAWAYALLLVVASSPEAAADDPSERRLPRQLIESSAPETTELTWRNGQRLVGELAGADGPYVHWKSALFTEEMAVRRDAAGRVDFAAKMTAPDEAFRFVFAGGSHLTGALKSIDEQTVSLVSASCGEVAASLDQLVAIERIKGPGILAGCPASLLSGESIAKGRFDKRPPYLAAAGNVVFLEFNGSVHQPLALPDKCLVSMRLRIEAQPAFSVVLAGESQWVTLETWDDELVLATDDQFASAGTALTENDGRFDIELAWDQVAGTCVLFSPDGTNKAELKLNGAGESEPLPSFDPLGPFLGPVFDHVLSDPGTLSRARLGGRAKGITVTNRGAGFVVERYTVSEWTGSAPPGPLETAAFVQTADESIAGETVACDGTTVTVRTSDGTDRDLPLAAVRSMRWPRQIDVERDPALTNLWYSNGNFVRGTMKGISDGKAHFTTDFANAPVIASLEHCRALQLPEPDSAEGTGPPLNELDVIAAGELTLHGTIQPGGGILPGFLPTGGDAALIPVARENLIMTRHLPAERDYARAPALLHTKANETLPVTLQKLAADKIVFTWGAAKAREVAASMLHAVQLAPPVAKVEQGFGEEGWQILGRRGNYPERTENGIVLKPDTGIAHPYLLQGEDFGFSFVKGEELTSMRIRLFCQGMNRNSDSMNFLVAHYGNYVYGGIEQVQEGRMESSRSFQVESETAPVRVEFKFVGDSVELRINGDVMASSGIKGKTGRKTGAGLILETASMWGNRFGPVTVSGFSMRASPSLVGAPPFSDDAKREALLLPRLRRDVPPRHILIGRNGDLLRGEIGDTSSAGNFLFRVGLEHLEIPMDRIAAAVWVQAPDQSMERNVRKESAESADDEAALEVVPEPGADSSTEQKPPVLQAEAPGGSQPGKVLESSVGQWLDLTNGGRFRLEVESWSSESVIGTHPILGTCAIPTEVIHRIALVEPQPGGALAALANWKFENTLDPNPPGLEEADVSPLVGKPAPDFTLAMLEGEDFTLSKAKGKAVVLDFWATWCAPCVRSLPLLIEAMAGFPQEKVAFVTVNQGESPKQVQRFLETRSLRMPVAFDPDMETGANFGAEAIPYTVVIDPTGTVTYVTMGASPQGEQKIAAAVARALGDGVADGE